MGPIWAFLGKPHMPISALNGTGVDILMWVYPEWVTHNSVVRKKTNSYVYTYFQLNFVLICDHLDLNCYYLDKNSN